MHGNRHIRICGTWCPGIGCSCHSFSTWKLSLQVSFSFFVQLGYAFFAEMLSTRYLVPRLLLFKQFTKSVIFHDTVSSEVHGDETSHKRRNCLSPRWAVTQLWLIEKLWYISVLEWGYVCAGRCSASIKFGITGMVSRDVSWVLRFVVLPLYLITALHNLQMASLLTSLPSFL